jgi:regulator of CtrA degradation
VSGNSSDDGNDRGTAVTIDFAKKYAESEQFKAVFREGMALVEATAAYLDGDGRREARALEQNAALAYASESMRLTTRLMQLASWLLIRRAVTEGEMTPFEALEQNNRIALKPFDESERSAYFEALPTSLKDLIDTTNRLLVRVVKIDHMLSDEPSDDVPRIGNPLGVQMARLSAAFDNDI